MKLRKASGTLGLAALALFCGPQAIAQGAGWYAGGNVGRSTATIDNAGIANGLAGQGLGTTSISDRQHDTGYKLFGGYQFTPNIGVEAGFFDLGHFGYTATTVPAGTLSGDLRARGVNLDLVGTMPLVGRLSALGRVGVTRIRSTDHFTATGAASVPYANANPSETSTNWKAGLGLMYDITDSLAVRAEVERYRLKDAVKNMGHVDMVSVGLIYRFGVRPEPRRVAAPMPMPMPAPMPMAMAAPPPPAPMAAPAPAYQPPPPPPPPRAAPMRVSLSADSLFDFDKSIIKQAGRASLDKLASDLRGVSYDAIQVTGHTDRIGGHDYNMKLSQRRAQAVSDYLVQSGGVAANRITARGVDGANPVTKPGDCKGNKPTAALIACLAPDRRVEVEVTGTR